MQDSPLWVLDKQLAKGHWATPRTTGYEKDFYKVDNSDGRNPDDQAVEKYFADYIESPAADVLRSIDATHSIPDRNTGEYVQLMAFIASCFIRGHAGWDLATKGADRIGRQLAHKMLNTPGAWEKTMADLRLAETVGETDISVAAIREFMEHDAAFDLDRNTKLAMLLSLIVPLARLLGSCRWHPVARQTGAPAFLLSDQPLSIQWSPGRHRSAPPTIGHPDNAFTLPISRDLLLRGIRHGSVRARQLDSHAVEHVNALTAFHGHRFVYSETDSPRAQLAGTQDSGQSGILASHKNRVVLHDMTGGPAFDIHGRLFLSES